MAKKKASDPVGDFNFGANRKPRKAKAPKGGKSTGGKKGKGRTSWADYMQGA